MGVGWFEAILYVFAAISTGGYSPLEASLAGLQSPYAQLGIVMLSFFGGISLILYSRPFLKTAVR